MDTDFWVRFYRDVFGLNFSFLPKNTFSIKHNVWKLCIENKITIPQIFEAFARFGIGVTSPLDACALESPEIVKRYLNYKDELYFLSTPISDSLYDFGVTAKYIINSQHKNGLSLKEGLILVLGYFYFCKRIILDETRMVCLHSAITGGYLCLSYLKERNVIVVGLYPEGESDILGLSNVGFRYSLNRYLINRNTPRS